MTIEEAMELIHGVEWRGSRPGLTRVRELLHRLGDPQDGLQFVHIAGTNGKGSTCAFLDAALRARVTALIADAAADKTLVLATHDAADAAALGCAVYAYADGTFRRADP